MRGMERHTPDVAPLIAHAADLLRRAQQAVALSGAGISTSSGIPDFRSPGCGLWEHADPLAVASIAGFGQHPEAFYTWIRPLARQVVHARPNAAHVALARLEAAGTLRSVITQNIDGLHQRAGSRRVHEVHGHLREATCTRCGRVVATDALLTAFIACNEAPRCACGGVVKPNVVLFGEELPAEIWAAAEQDVEACDLLLVVGSSLAVAPASGLPLRAAGHGARIIIVNYEPTPVDGLADVVMHLDVVQVLPRIVDLTLN